MVESVAAPVAPTVGDPAVNLAVFGAVVALTLVAVVRAGRVTRTAADYYTAGPGFTGRTNGVAMAGDYLSAAAFLGVVGAVAVAGYDGVTFAIGSMIGWVIALLLLAERVRNTGRYTMGDVLGFRAADRRVRAAAAISTLTVSLMYLVAQIAGAGGLVALLLGVPGDDRGTQSVVIVVVGLLMVFYVLIGGMRGTTWVQVIKAVLLGFTALVLAVWVLGRWGFDGSRLLGAAVDAHPAGERLLEPGILYGSTGLDKIDFISLSIAGLLGPASLPHILMRFFTVPDAREARRSTVWAVWLIGTFFLLTLAMGFGATALVGPQAILAAPGASNAAAPLLAWRLGGELMLGLVAAVAFATILAVVAGLTITASASFAHDVYAQVLRRGQRVDARQEIRVARATALVVGVVATVGGLAVNGQNVAVLIGLAFAVAASANLPALLLTLYWPRFTVRGLQWSMYGGMLTAVVLVVFSPAVSGRPDAVLPDVDFAWFPLANPGIVSVPVSFALAVAGSLLPGAVAGRAAWAETEVRSLVPTARGR
ncbi:MAG: cation acetate symporter [Pseudonocardiales bacterium]|nr:cation acetate symporter [Pseudonocardiales bacterium]